MPAPEMPSPARLRIFIRVWAPDTQTTYTGCSSLSALPPNRGRIPRRRKFIATFRSLSLHMYLHRVFKLRGKICLKSTQYDFIVFFSIFPLKPSSRELFIFNRLSNKNYHRLDMYIEYQLYVYKEYQLKIDQTIHNFKATSEKYSV